MPRFFTELTENHIKKPHDNDKKCDEIPEKILGEDIK